jgi:hypothetical protein
LFFFFAKNIIEIQLDTDVPVLVDDFADVIRAVVDKAYKKIVKK